VPYVVVADEGKIRPDAQVVTVGCRHDAQMLSLAAKAVGRFFDPNNCSPSSNPFSMQYRPAMVHDSGSLP
jgi:hypothetical protein